MNVNQLSTVAGGPLSAAGDFDLLVKDASQMFRQVRYLRLPLPASLDYLQFLPQASLFNVQFKTLSYNALNHASADLRANVEKTGHWLRITLPAPAQLSSITLKSPHGGFLHSIGIHRIDGDAIAEEASASASIASSVTTVFGVNQATKVAGKTSNQRKTAQQSRLAFNQRLYQTNFTGQEFALHLLDSNDNVDPNFSPDWLAALTITSYPSTPQLALVLPVIDEVGGQLTLPLDNAIPLWTEAGELGKADTPAATLQTLGTRLAESLQTGLKRLAEDYPLSDSGFIDVALLFNSSAACEVMLADFNMAYQAVKRGSVNASEEKITLRFKRNNGQTLPLQLALPADISSGKINLSIDESIATGSATSDSATTLLETLVEPVASNQSLRLNEADKALQPLTISKPVHLQGVILALSTLSDNASIDIELIADKNGAPNGDSLLHTGPLPVPSKSKRWQRFSISDSLLLSSGNYWLAVHINQGIVYWYLRNAPPGQSIHRQPANGTAKQFRDWSAYYQLQSTSSINTNPAQSRTRLQLADQPLSATPTDNGRFDYSFALSPMFDPAQPIELAVTSAGKGLMTVYPPEIVFDFA